MPTFDEIASDSEYLMLSDEGRSRVRSAYLQKYPGEDIASQAGPVSPEIMASATQDVSAKLSRIPQALLSVLRERFVEPFQRAGILAPPENAALESELPGWRPAETPGEATERMFGNFQPAAGVLGMLGTAASPGVRMASQYRSAPFGRPMQPTEVLGPELAVRTPRVASEPSFTPGLTTTPRRATVPATIEEAVGRPDLPMQPPAATIPRPIRAVMEPRTAPSGGVDPAPIFYSQLARTIDQKMPNRAAPEQVSAIARSGGVKEDEIKWTGLDDWLKEQTGPVSKQDVANFLRANQVAVQESVKPREASPELVIQREAAGRSLRNQEAALKSIQGPDEIPAVRQATEETRLAFRNVRDWVKSQPDLNTYLREWNSEMEDSTWLSNSIYDAVVHAHKQPANPPNYRVQEVYDRLVKEIPHSLRQAYFTANDKLVQASEAFWKDQKAREPEIEAMRQGINAARQRYDSLTQQIEGASPKFSTWQIPGGENYRELVLTLPSAVFQVKPAPGNTFDVVGPTGELIRKGLLREDADSLAARLTRGGAGFTSPHWDEPNVLAHVRFNERTDAQGKKVLFIEEIQSDWHQEGRRKGYALTELPPDRFVVEHQPISDRGERWVVRDKETGRAVDEGETPEAARQNTLAILNRGGAVPSAPFAKAWHELVLKRMLRWAAEKGFDKVAWTTGEQQAARYDLSKQLDAIEGYRFPGGKVQQVRIDSGPRQGQVVWFAVGEKGKVLGDFNSKEQAEAVLPKPSYKVVGIRSGDRLVDTRASSEAELANIVGKDLANKIANQEHGVVVYDSPNLKIGGEWAKHLYDEMIPQFLNKYGKKWGARVGETEVLTPSKKQTPYTIAQTPDGFAVIKKGVDEEIVDVSAIYKDRSDAARRALELNRLGGSATVHSLDITPEMKHSVMFQGQPLFALIPPLIASAALASQRRGERDHQPAGATR